MCSPIVRVSAILFGLLIAFDMRSFADEVERDRCACKLALKGAESTLKGGVCVRTESSTCLMEWGGGSTAPVSQGNGLSQRDASLKVQEEFTRANDIRLEIPRLAPTAENPTPLEIATANLARVPPSAYDKPGMPESFLLAAGTALMRFATGPINFLATILLRDKRNEFIIALKDHGELKVEQFTVSASTGCLQVEDPTQKPQAVHIFVKTPFANPERC
jgi:hypothetical protein